MRVMSEEVWWLITIGARRCHVLARLWYEARERGSAMLGVSPLDCDCSIAADGPRD